MTMMTMMTTMMNPNGCRRPRQAAVYVSAFRRSYAKQYLSFENGKPL
jgi:hypothetical protein